MKKSVVFILILAVVLTAGFTIASALLVIDGGGIDFAAKTSDCVINLGKSEKFNDGELDNACRAVKKYFRTFNDCSLLTIEYDETESNSIIEEYLKSDSTIITSAENSIILTSSFEALTDYAGKGSFNKGEIDGWRWILTRNSANGKWHVKGCGY
ncbi:MAG: hypothetical protein NC122_01265 [Faecalibacterium sp.]|nr:hypothetical protein [Ruminococcus sp.]MCM1392689.1 hypothetical protein [Ruminococcus sp.]MCM1484818.1 hypothetical protein [Faecalibacterium sp.]